MMALSQDLINMESEFRILNQELENKAEELFKRADNIVKNQERSMQDLVTPQSTNRESERMFQESKSSDIGPTYRNSDTTSLQSSCDESMGQASDHVKQLLAKRTKIKNKHRTFDSDDCSHKSSNASKCPNGKSKARERLQSNARESLHKSKALECLPTNARECSHDKSSARECLFDSSNTRDCFRVMSSLGNFEMESLDDDSELDDDEVDNMMKVLDDQKKYNKSVIGLINTKESIRRKRDKLNSGDSGNLDRNTSDATLKCSRTSVNEITALTQAAEKSKTELVMVRSLQSKVKSLQDELNKTKEQLKKKTVECEACTKATQGFVENKLKLLGQVNSLRSQGVKLECQVSGLTSQLQAKESELSSEREERMRLQREAEKGEASQDARLATAGRELASLREQLALARAAEKGAREEGRRHSARLEAELAASSRRSGAVVRGLRAHAALADNLRRQTALLASAREVRTVDGQLDTLLQWEPTVD